MRFSLFAVIAVLALSGCNTRVHDSYQRISVDTPGVPNALCTMETDRNKYVVLTARQVVVERSKLPMTVTCEKTGYYPGTITVTSESHMPEAPFNIFNGGMPGIAYDVASNSIYSYPDIIIVAMRAKPSVEQESEEPYVLPMKTVEIEPAPVATAPAPGTADKAMKESLKK